LLSKVGWWLYVAKGNKGRRLARVKRRIISLEELNARRKRKEAKGKKRGNE